jgi:aliphatic nitrilase
MIVGPDGSLRSEIRRDEEGIVLVEIDASEVLEYKQHHDMAGYYNRLDIFSVILNCNRPEPVYFDRATPLQKQTEDNLFKMQTEQAAE